MEAKSCHYPLVTLPLAEHMSTRVNHTSNQIFLEGLYSLHNSYIILHNSLCTAYRSMIFTEFPAVNLKYCDLLSRYRTPKLKILPETSKHKTKHMDTCIVHSHMYACIDTSVESYKMKLRTY